LFEEKSNEILVLYNIVSDFFNVSKYKKIIKKEKIRFTYEVYGFKLNNCQHLVKLPTI